jgi:hypothetical protein
MMAHTPERQSMLDAIEKYEEELEEFQDALKIDKLRLDSEIAKQADLYFRVSQRTSEVISYRDAAKHKISVIEAETSSNYRTNGIEDIGRVTDTAVKEATTTNSKVKTAHRDYIMWRRVADEWIGLQSATEQRNRMLQTMAQLYASGYFTITSAGRADTTHTEARARAGRELMNAQRSERPRLKRED